MFKDFIGIIVGFILNLSFANASSMSSIKVQELNHVGVTCFSDRGTDIELSSANTDISKNQGNVPRFVISGVIRQSSHPLRWGNPAADFSLEVGAERDELSTIRLISNISVLNPYMGEREELHQSTISYLEFHILRDRLHEPGSTGFTSDDPSYGFGVQCFFSGL